MSQLLLNFTRRSENIRYFVTFHKLSHQSVAGFQRSDSPKSADKKLLWGHYYSWRHCGNSHNHLQNTHQWTEGRDGKEATYFIPNPEQRAVTLSFFMATTISHCLVLHWVQGLLLRKSVCWLQPQHQYVHEDFFPFKIDSKDNKRTVKQYRLKNAALHIYQNHTESPTWKMVVYYLIKNKNMCSKLSKHCGQGN